MDFIYKYQGLEFEWDTNKARINMEKHGITFEEAIEVFFDPFYQMGDAFTNNETREFIIGYSSNYRLLFVIYLERGQRIGLISARNVTKYESQLYEKS